MSEEKASQKSTNEDKASTYLITGAQGFIGAYICKQLLSSSDSDKTNIVGFDLKKDTGIFDQVLSVDMQNRIKMVYGDVTNFQALLSLVQDTKPTFVIHLAGLQIPTCKVNPALGAMVNVVGTINVFEAVRQFNESVEQASGRIQCVVYASSAGACGPESDYKDGVCHDQDHHKPRTHYGVFKLANEGNARVFWNDHAIPSVGLRPLVVYGVGREIGMTSAPTKAVKSAILGRKLEIPFQGITSFNFVEDVADLFIRCVTSVKSGSHACSIKGNHASIEDFVAAVTQVLPNAASLISVKKDGSTIPFPSKYAEDTLPQLIGPVEPTPLAAGVSKMVEHFQKNQASGVFHDRDLQ